jgi:hypothetical protein
VNYWTAALSLQVLGAEVSPRDRPSWRHRRFEGPSSSRPPRGGPLVDDWNIPEVREGARDAVRAGGLSVLWHRELPGDHTRDGWWNGLGVFFVERSADCLAG